MDGSSLFKTVIFSTKSAFQKKCVLPWFMIWLPSTAFSSLLPQVTSTLMLHNIDKGYITWVVFLDLSKAFDTLDHQILHDKLSNFRFDCSAVQWFSIYLTHRTQSSYLYQWYYLRTSISSVWVFQRLRVLGQFLFIMYINDPTLAVSSCSIVLYADDALIFFESKSAKDIESNLKFDLMICLDGSFQTV